MTTTTYTITGDANELSGWTAETLAAALATPLAALGVAVECRPRQSGGGGLSNGDDALGAAVTQIVERVIEAGR